MRSVSIRQLDMKLATIPLGFEGENDFTEVRIDCKKTFDQHPNAVPSMIVTDPAGNKYPAVVTRDGDIVVWNITAGDLTTKGSGEIQIEFLIDGTVIGRTDVARTRIERSIFAEGEAPDPVQDWVSEANRLLALIRSAIPAGGTVGQFLGKKSNSDYDTEWKTPSGGGGGGTTNYNDLDNKPQIEGHTLTGNVTLETLGALSTTALAAAITTALAQAKQSGEFDGADGDDGVGIADIEKTGTSGLVDTYTITLTDGTTSTFTVTNGAKGDPGNPGADGVSPTVAVSSITGGHRVSVSDKNGTQTFDVMDGVSAIDDTAGRGDTDKVLSADKVTEITDGLREAIGNRKAHEEKTNILNKIQFPVEPVWFGKYTMGDGGTIVSNSNRYAYVIDCTGFDGIIVKENTFKMYAFFTSYPTAGSSAYDGTRYYNADVDTLISVPSTAKYLFVVMYSDIVPAALVNYENIDSRINGLRQDTATEFGYILTGSRNLFNSEWENGKKINTSTGAIETETNSAISGIIHIDEKGYYRVSMLDMENTVDIGVHFYVDDVWDSFYGSVNANSIIIYVPTGINGVQFTSYHSSNRIPPRSMLEKGLIESGYTTPEKGVQLNQDKRNTVNPYILKNSSLGKNKFDKGWMLGSISNSGDTEPGTRAAKTDYIQIEPNKKYTVSWESVADTLSVYLNYYTDESNVRSGYKTISGKTNAYTFTTGYNWKYVRIATYSSDTNVTTLNQLMLHYLQIEEGETATQYETPYYILDEKESDLPNDYYFANGYLSGKANAINNLISSCANNGDVFIFITDMHWEINARQSPKIIKWLCQNCNIPRIFNGGDNTNGENMTVSKLLRQALGSDKVYFTDGNHEFLSKIGSASDYGTYGNIFYSNRMFLEDAVYGDGKRDYYYVDNTPQKIRYIVLATYGEIPSGQSVAQSLFANDSNQLMWFTNVALNVENGWTILIFTHTASASGWYPDYANAIANYNGNGTIAAVIVGHSHYDQVRKLNNSEAWTSVSDGVPIIVTTCDKYVPALIGENQYDLNVDRTRGTITEQAFDVVVLDKSNKKLSFVRIGSPAANTPIGGGAPDIPVEIREFYYP